MLLDEHFGYDHLGYFQGNAVIKYFFQQNLINEILIKKTFKRNNKFVFNIEKNEVIQLFDIN